MSLLTLHDNELSLEALLAAVDLSTITPAVITDIAFNRPPKDIGEAVADAGFSPWRQLLAAVQSDEYASNFAPMLLRTFPEVRRHVLFSAGAGQADVLASALRSTCLTLALDQQAGQRFSTTAAMAKAARFIRSSTWLFAHTDLGVADYLQLAGYRSQDRFFMVLPEPVDALLIRANRLAGAFLADVEQRQPITKLILAELGLSKVPEGISHRQYADLMIRIASKPAICRPNGICGLLAPEATLDAALATLATLNIEVTTADRFEAWCRESWGLEVDGVASALPKGLERRDFSALQDSLLKALTTEDRRLHDLVLSGMNRAGFGSSVGGMALARSMRVASSPVLPGSGAVARASDGAPGVEPVRLVDIAESADAAPAVRELVLQFESLGENCEFGLLQRRAGAEPLGLLRFSSTPWARLLAALKGRFAGLGDPDRLRVELSANRREYMVAELQFGLLWHAWVLVGEQTPEEIHRREVRRLPLLVRKLRDDLEAGEKIFVFHGMAPLTSAQAESLANALALHGPATLLWMELADAENPAGSVRRLTPNLLKGHMDRFAPSENAHDLSEECWLTVCRNAYALAKR